MNDIELTTNIKASLERLSLPSANAAGDNSLIMGYCHIEGEPSAFNFVVKVASGYSTIYMIAPYGAEAFAANDFYKRMAAVNLVLAKGHFNADMESKRLIYKWVYLRHRLRKIAIR